MAVPLHPRRQLFDKLAKVADSSIERLELRYRSFEDDEALALSHALMTNESLRELDLTSCPLTSIGLTRICHALPPSLVKLSLSYNPVDTQTASALADVLSMLPCLRDLRLCGCQISEAGLIAFSNGLSESILLATIVLSNNRPALRNQEQAYQIFGGALARISCLRHVDLSNDLMNSSDLYALQLHRLTSLQFLYLGANQIDSGSGQALNQILRDCSELRELDLHNNKLGDLGVIQAFNTTEPIAVSLESLSLTTNLLSDESICNLAANFLATSRITFLRLALNEIGDRGALAMASFLSSPTCRLKTLILHHNRIHTQGAEALVDVMQTGRNTLISELGISHNPISKHELFHLARFYTKLNRHGRYLLLDPNSIPQSLWAHVLARISHEADSRNYFIQQLPELFDTARRYNLYSL